MTWIRRGLRLLVAGYLISLVSCTSAPKPHYVGPVFYNDGGPMLLLSWHNKNYWHGATDDDEDYDDYDVACGSDTTTVDVGPSVGVVLGWAFAIDCIQVGDVWYVAGFEYGDEEADARLLKELEAESLGPWKSVVPHFAVESDVLLMHAASAGTDFSPEDFAPRDGAPVAGGEGIVGIGDAIRLSLPTGHYHVESLEYETDRALGQVFRWTPLEIFHGERRPAVEVTIDRSPEEERHRQRRALAMEAKRAAEDDDFAAAIAKLDEILPLTPRDTEPQLWAKYRGEQGDIYNDWARHVGKDPELSQRMEQAKQAFLQALSTEYTSDDAADERADLFYRLASSRLGFAFAARDQRSVELCREAIAAYNEAATIYRAQDSYSWASAYSSIALCWRVIAANTDGEERFVARQNARSAETETLKVYTLDDAPSLFAEAQEGLAEIAASIAEEIDQNDEVKAYWSDEAVACQRLAIQGFVEAELTERWEYPVMLRTLAGYLGEDAAVDTDGALAKRNEAVKLLTEARDLQDSDDDEYPETLHQLAHASWKLAQLLPTTETRPYLQRAVAAMRTYVEATGGELDEGDRDAAKSFIETVEAEVHRLVKDEQN